MTVLPLCVIVKSLHHGKTYFARPPGNCTPYSPILSLDSYSCHKAWVSLSSSALKNEVFGVLNRLRMGILPVVQLGDRPINQRFSLFH